ncbi:hypothetical protein GKC30_03125 [Pseudodesulfovibrio sp. F-1]|uniref:Uncharacterized protein n=1 Tax=Pseudodesulfovibrio alkaliphilus TaxID=2661613 RepID=A0A7K1KL47_9BACT|nr:hypothetical protein [Pseudodesulfovibrio alkaliphilus]MUM76622.1 hypothetical protein [Pseudodesulfovibrio alkaliphilus]
MQVRDHSVSLRLAAEARFILLVQGVVEQGAAAFGLDRGKALRLTMAAEELLSHLAETSAGVAVDLTLTPGGWCVRADFSFVADPSDLWAMNLAAREDIGPGRSMDRLGLLLAARMSDGFEIRLDGRVVHLELRQDHAYEAVTPRPVRAADARGEVRVVDDPEPALIREACALAVDHYPAHLVNETFFTPGKAVQMADRGDMTVALAVDGTGAPAGLMTWRSPSERSVGFCGPYVFVRGGGTAGKLEEWMFAAVARTRAVSLFSELATADLTAENYELLGRLPLGRPGLRGAMPADGAGQEGVELDILFRHLREDSGRAVWTHPALRPFLEAAYDQLVLMRDIREVDHAGADLPERSVFSARLRPELGIATLAPMVAGRDADQAVADHVRTLTHDGYRSILFRLDLAHGWQAALAGSLVRGGFAPRLVLPDAGKSDMVVFLHG